MMLVRVPGRSRRQGRLRCQACRPQAAPCEACRHSPLAIEFADPTRHGVARLTARGRGRLRMPLSSRHPLPASLGKRVCSPPDRSVHLYGDQRTKPQVQSQIHFKYIYHWSVLHLMIQSSQSS